MNDIVRRCGETGLVDDRRYAEMKVAGLRRRGGSARLIAGKLHARGVDRELVDAALAESETDEPGAAAAFAHRRRLGPWRLLDRRMHRERDLAALARAGFAISVARSVVDGEGSVEPNAAQSHERPVP